MCKCLYLVIMKLVHKMINSGGGGKLPIVMCNYKLKLAYIFQNNV